MDIKKERLENCRITKTILMFIIVLYHSLKFWTGNWFSNNPYYISQTLSIVCEWLNSFHVAAFTFVSGYLFYYQKIELKKYQNFNTFIINKVKRLLIPYALVSLLWAIPFAIYYYKMDAVEIIHCFLFGIAPEQLWFLLMLFWVYLISFYLSSKWDKSPIICITITILVYIVGAIGGALVDNYFQLFTAFKYLPFFALGFYLRKVRIEKYKRLIFILLPVGIVLFALYHNFTASNVLLKFVRITMHTMCGCIGSILAFQISDLLTTKLKLSTNKTLLLLSSASMPIYLLHQQVIYITINLFNGHINYLLNILISFVSAIVLPFIIYSLIKKYKFATYLFGGK